MRQGVPFPSHVAQVLLHVYMTVQLSVARRGRCTSLVVMISRGDSWGLLAPDEPAKQQVLLDLYPFCFLAVSPNLLGIPTCVFRNAFDADWN